MDRTGEGYDDDYGDYFDDYDDYDYADGPKGLWSGDGFQDWLMSTGFYTETDSESELSIPYDWTNDPISMVDPPDMDGMDRPDVYPDNQPYHPSIQSGQDGPEVYPTKPIAPNREPYTGFWGTLNYIWTGGVENGIRYNYDGTVAGYAPLMGNPPIPAFKGGQLHIK